MPKTKSFRDFYNSIGFAPTRQQSDLRVEHKQNRDNLNRKLGIHASKWANASILEVGPGSGGNPELLACILIVGQVYAK